MGKTLGATLPSTPSMVLSYRAAWNDYVMSTACALQVQAWALNQAASSGQVPATVDPVALPCAYGTESAGPPLTAWATEVSGPIVDLSKFAMQPPSAALLQAAAQVATNIANNLVAEWDLYAGWTDAQVVLEAGAILESYQRTVLDAGQNGRPAVAQFSPAVAAVLPQGADPSAQAQLLAGIEGAQILASGVLDIITTGAGGFVTGVYTTAQWAKQKADQVVGAATSPWLWASVAAVVVAGAVVYVVLNVEKVKSLVAARAA